MYINSNIKELPHFKNHYLAYAGERVHVTQIN